MPLPTSNPNSSPKLLFNSAGEKRSSPRRPANDLAQILFEKHVIGCLIHNISDEGAQIEVSTSQVPDRFILANYNTSTRMVCKVVWRNHLHIGVKFVTIPKSFHEGFKQVPA